MFTVLLLLLLVTQCMMVLKEANHVETITLPAHIGSIHKSVLVVGIVRDIAEPLRKSIDRLMKLLPIFTRYQVFIYENDSTDGTKQVLQEAKDAFPDHFHYQCEDKIDDKLAVLYTKVERYEKMAEYRNKYIEELRKPQYDHMDYVMVFDFDSKGMFTANQLQRVFSISEPWDALFAHAQAWYRHVKSSFYNVLQTNSGYDTLAFVSADDTVFGFGQGIWGKHKRLVMRDDGPLVHVKSAFNGLSIYPRHILMQVRYSGRGQCEHIRLHQDMWDLGYTKTYIVPYLAWCHSTSFP